MLYLLFIHESIQCVYVCVFSKDEYERLKSSREEVMHTLNELRARCEEVESQRDEEAENCQLLKVPLCPFELICMGFWHQQVIFNCRMR